MKNYKFNKTAWFVLLLLFFGFSACKKHDSNPKKDQTNRLSDTDSLKYYIWNINISDSSKPISSLKSSIWGWVPMYYWYEDVPQDFNWKNDKYNGNNLGATGTNLMRAIAAFTPKFKGTPEDRYSFIDAKGEVSKELEGGQKGDFGYMVAATRDKNSKIHLFIEYVYPGSPADNGNLKRGDEIIAINGNANMDVTLPNNADRINKDLFQKQDVSMKLAAPDGTIFTADMQKDEYHLNPLLFHDIYEVDGKKVGYFVYNAFVNVSSSKNGMIAKQEIDTVFGKFKDAGIRDLIVDLRFNGGGSVATAVYLDNLMAPASTVGKEMFHYEYNQPLTSFFENNDGYKENFLTPIKFQSEPNNLNLSRVFFIVSRGTASAAELTMNNLRPYMDVQLVGDTTYGKPVGFFTIPINFVTKDKGYQHVADMYSINFKSVNSAGVSDYFNGLVPDIQFPDYVDIRWGKEDPNLQTIFHKISNGSYLSPDDIVRKRNANARKVAEKIKPYMRKISSPKIHLPHPFKGMVDYKRSQELQKSFLK